MLKHDKKTQKVLADLSSHASKMLYSPGSREYNPEFLYSPLKIIVINIYLYVSTQSHKLCSLIKFLIVYK